MWWFWGFPGIALEALSRCRHMGSLVPIFGCGTACDWHEEQSVSDAVLF